MLVFCMSCVWQLLNKQIWWWWWWTIHNVELMGEDLLRYSTKIESSDLSQMSLWSLTDQQSVFKQYHSMRVLSTKWRKIPACIDMERNYITVTLYIMWYSDLLWLPGCCSRHIKWTGGRRSSVQWDTISTWGTCSTTRPPSCRPTVIHKLQFVLMTVLDDWFLPAQHYASAVLDKRLLNGLFLVVV